MVAVFPVVVFAIIHLATQEFAKPKRRSLQAYHLEYLESPSSYGVSIKRGAFLEPKIPCLIVEPNARSQPGEKGSLLRNQLRKRKIPLPVFGEIQAQLVILHGRGGRKEDVLSVAERFSAIGFRCLLPDLPGHGDSPIEHVGYGGNEFEQNMVNRIVMKASAAGDLDEKPFAILGISMGGAYTVKTVQQGGNWYSLAIVSSFDDLDKVITRQCEKRAGVLSEIFKRAVVRKAQNMSGLETGKIQPEKWAESISIPVLVAHGTDDALIPMTHGEALFRAFGSVEKKWLDVPDAGHNNVLTTPMEVYAELAEWFLEHRAEK